MKSIIISENMRGLLFKNGVLKEVLLPGKYHTTNSRQIETVYIKDALSSEYVQLNQLLANDTIKSSVTIYEVKDGEIALRYTDGIFTEVLKPGKYAFWKDAGSIEIKLIDVSNPEVSEDISREIFDRMPGEFYRIINVPEHFVAQLYINHAFIRMLDSGVYYFWNTSSQIDIRTVYTGRSRVDVVGQEILSQDKVTLRLSFICYYTIKNPEKVYTEIDDLSESIHITVQLALRDYVGNHTIDELLMSKDEISSFVMQRLKEKEASL